MNGIRRNKLLAKVLENLDCSDAQMAVTTSFYEQVRNDQAAREGEIDR